MTRWVLIGTALVFGAACSESDETANSSETANSAGSSGQPAASQGGSNPVNGPMDSKPGVTVFEPPSDAGPAQGGTDTGTTDPASGSVGGQNAAGGSGGRPEGCVGGPLDAPIDGCEPDFEESGDFYQDCVDRINQLRWECQCLPPLERWTEGEACADQHAEYDYNQDEPHAGFQDDICDKGGSSQNECPGYSPNFDIINACLQQMWDEGPGEDFQAHGHYINMSSTSATKVACGLFITPDNRLWSVQNFSR